ncbi:YybH family protein [Anaeromyxobacter terrae]|uniref:YybH family protein n=1 Tax=Anaeromyxobacter terrae TaxID=2925406 RepID=UPI001F584D4B|nr:nuclear transport factor 2 family protein [Anaeromyxobacter sp. SG22]
METMQDVGTKDYKAEPSLETAFRKFNEAFNRFDTKQVAAFWAEDGTLITPIGEVGKGRSGVEAAYRHDCETILAGTTSRFTISSVRRLGDELAFMDLDHELQNFRMPDGSTGTMKLHLVVLAKKSGSTWQWLDARPYAYLPPLPSVH